MLEKNIQTFIACDAEYEASEIVLFGAPFDSTTSFRPGTRFGPPAIRNESFGIETYSPYQDKDMTDYSYFDCGDIELPFGSVRRAIADIAGRTDIILNDGKLPFMIGGEHLVTFGTVMAVNDKFDDLYIIHFDAHADLRDDYLGQQLSHACVIRRCHELVGDGHIFQFGIRSGDREEFRFADEHTYMNKFNFDELEDVVEKLKGKNVYFTLDLDVLDPSIFPGTGTPEAGGVTFEELRKAVTLVCSELNIVGCDVNELSPHYDQSGASTAVACKIIREMLLALSGKLNEKGTSVPYADVSLIPLEELDLSVRAYNNLKRAGINNLHDMIGMTEEDLLKVRNLGKKNCDAVLERIADFDLVLRDGVICFNNNIDAIKEIMWKSIDYANRNVKKIKALKMVFAEDKNIGIIDSKSGGIPYLPIDEYPPCIENSDTQLKFLMQINCDRLNGFEALPSHGIIQFWIDPFRHVIHDNMSDDHFRVIYYDKIDSSVNVFNTHSKINKPAEHEENYFTLKGEPECKISFLPVEEFERDEYERLFCERYNYLTGENITSYYSLPSNMANIVRIYGSNGIKCKDKIGGVFSINDVNCISESGSYEKLKKYYPLVQLSDKSMYYWEADNSCYFFIDKEKLKSCDFSDMRYIYPEQYCDDTDV